MKRIEIITYKDITITKMLTGYSVEFCGDEIFFGSLEQAKKFIDDNF